jgi:hypothetical protein
VPILVYDAEGIITVHTPVPVEIRAHCFAPELHLLVAPDAERLAYRCAADRPWRVIFLGTKGRTFFQCSGAETTEAVLDWTGIPDLQSAFVACQTCNVPSALDKEAKDRGEPWVLGALERARATQGKMKPGPGVRDPWLRVFESLPEGKRSEAARPLEGTLERPEATVAEVWRSLAVAGEAERATSGSIARAYTRLVHDETAHDVYTAWAGGALLRALHSRDASTAATLACTTLSKTSGASWLSSTLTTHALMVLAVAPAPCPAVGTVAVGLCDESLDCGAKDDRHLCTMDELGVELREELARPPSEAAADYFVHHKHDRAVYAAALAAGSVSEATRLRNERRHYQVEPRDPWCTAVETPGQPCACFSSTRVLAKVMCELDWKASHATRSPCAIIIDDVGKRIRSSRSP